jgi:hypothetical protein
MTALTWPSSLIPASCDIGLKRQTVQHQSQITSQVQAVELGTEFWRMNVTMPARARSESGEMEAFFNQLVGGVQTVSAWHFSRPIPKGTMRGTPTLSANAAQFSRSLSLAGVFGAGRRWGDGASLEGWRAYANNPDFGAWDVAGTYAAGTMGPADSGDLIIERLLGPAEQFSGGLYHVVRARMKRIVGASWTGILYYHTASHTYDGSHYCIAPEPSWDADGWGLVEWNMSLAVGAADWSSSTILNLRFDLHRASGHVGEVAYIDWIEVSNGPGTYTAGTLLAGDMIGVSGQLFQAAANADADAYGNMTVQTVNRVRVALSSGASVAWYRPSAEFMVLEDQSAFSHGVDAMSQTSFSLIEAP